MWIYRRDRAVDHGWAEDGPIEATAADKLLPLPFRFVIFTHRARSRAERGHVDISPRSGRGSWMGGRWSNRSHCRGQAPPPPISICDIHSPRPLACRARTCGYIAEIGPWIMDGRKMVQSKPLPRTSSSPSHFDL